MRGNVIARGVLWAIGAALLISVQLYLHYNGFQGWELLALLVMLNVLFLPLYLLARVIGLGREIRHLQHEFETRVEPLERSLAQLRKTLGLPLPEAAEAVTPLPTPARAIAPEPAHPTQPIFLPTERRGHALRVEPAQQPEHAPFDVERLFGANWPARLGVAAIALATAFFLQYAFKSGWIGPTARVVGGMAVSGTLLAAGQLLLGKPRYRSYAEVLSAGGIVVLFLSIYAAYSFYHLIPFRMAFPVMVVASLAASTLAIANNTLVPAVLCVLGAFAAPVLIRQQAGTPSAGELVRLYTYVAVLNVWVLGMLRLRPWYSLAVVAFAGTWSLFLGAGPLGRQNQVINEAFATLFLAFACLPGYRALNARREAPARDTTVGLGLIFGGVAFFATASFLALGEMGVLGLPVMTAVVTLIVLLLALAAVALPLASEIANPIRTAFGYLAATSLALLMLTALFHATPPQPHQVPIAFGFAVFHYLLFLTMAVVMRRHRATEAPAAALAAAAAFIHIVMAFHILHRTTLDGIPAAALWLPASAVFPLTALRWTRDEGARQELATALSVSALVLPVMVLYGVVPATGDWPALTGLVLFFLEFQAVTGAWLAMRRRTRALPLRLDIAAGFVNCVVFFWLMARTAGGERYQGLVLLAGGAIAMAAFLTSVGASILRQADDDRLIRLTYLGLALTFLTLAIPLQLNAGWVTFAWAVEAVVLMWTGIAAGERRMRQAGLGLLALAAGKAVFRDLLVNPVPFHFLFNLRMLAGASVIAAAYGAARLLWTHRETLEPGERRIPAALVVAANLVTLLFGSVDLWQHVSHTWAPADRQNACQLGLSLFWTAYALAGVVIGIWRRLRPVRLFAMGLLYVAISKVFLFDLSGLEQPYRIVSFFALGVILLMVSLLYTRFEDRLRTDETEDAGDAGPTHQGTLRLTRRLQ